MHAGLRIGGRRDADGKLTPAAGLQARVDHRRIGAQAGWGVNLDAIRLVAGKEVAQVDFQFDGSPGFTRLR